MIKVIITIGKVADVYVAVAAAYQGCVADSRLSSEEAARWCRALVLRNLSDKLELGEQIDGVTFEVREA